MEHIIDLKVVWNNPDEFSVFFKTIDGGSGVIEGTFSGEDNIELIPNYDNLSVQAENFFKILNTDDIVYKDFFEKYAHNVKYCKYDVFRLVAVYKENDKIQRKQIAAEFYNEETASWRIQIELDDNPNGWLDNKDTQELLEITYEKDQERVNNY